MNKEQKMTLSQLAKIIAQSSSLFERLHSEEFKVNKTKIDEQKVKFRLERMCEAIAQGNWEKFQKWLRWNNLSINDMHLALGALPLVDHKTMPNWAETLQKMIQPAPNFDSQIQNTIHLETQNLTPLDPEIPLPFEDVLLPAVIVARQNLLIRLETPSLSLDYLPLELFTRAAYLTLERNLLERLVQLSAKTLLVEFSQSRPIGHNLLNLLIGETQQKYSKIQYNDFVQKFLSDGGLTFFQKYPVLGRLLATTIDFWVEATAEFMQRLKADLAEIQQVFNHPRLEAKSKELGKVTKIQPSLSDPHHYGRTVIAFTFESGLSLVYKPKDLSLEVAYTQFLNWCNQHDNGLLPFKVLKVLNRQEYGWVEYVEQLPCEDEAAVQRFYQRAGMLQCLLYILGSTDCHHENLIANGEHLVLVDMETLMHHDAKPIDISFEPIAVDTIVEEQFWNSALRTGLLPRWSFDKDNRIAFDISGLGSVTSQQAPTQVARWKSVNTDDMHLAHETASMSVQANVPTLKGKTLSPNDYLGKVITGFEQMYRFLMIQREILLTTGSSLAALSAKRVRFVFRDTRVYSAILQKSLAPDFLRDGVDRSIELCLLSRAFLTTKAMPNAWPILQSELDFMEQLDIPYFGAYSDSDALTIGLQTPIKQYFKAPSYNQVTSRLKKLNEVDLTKQIAIIQGAFHARIARMPKTNQSSVPKLSIAKEARISRTTQLSPDQLFKEAQNIAQEIREQALKGVDGSINWIGLSYIPNAQRYQLQPLGMSLYDGRCGVALFLAALDYVEGGTRFYSLALGALQSLQKILHNPNREYSQRFARFTGIGGATGLGSVIFALVKTSQFLRQPSLLEDALQVAYLITPELIAADQHFDVMGGAAGAILGLLALYHETSEPAILDKAVVCGQHLLAHRVSIDGGSRAWKTFSEKPLTGFSHGAAGMCLALLRLYKITHNVTFLEAAKEGIAYEQSVFSPAANNWPDFRFVTKQNSHFEFAVSWCHGAPGIGLARLGGLSVLSTEEILKDINIALQTTLEYDKKGVDHLCCGNFGRIEVLLAAAQKLIRPELRGFAQQRATWLVNEAKQTNAYRLFANLPKSVFSPCLFQGTAGIGYELLRLMAPEKLPSVLLWE